MENLLFRLMDRSGMGKTIVQNRKKNVDKNWKKWYIYEQKHGGVPCGHWYGDTEKTYNEAVMRIVTAERFSVGRELIPQSR